MMSNQRSKEERHCTRRQRQMTTTATSPLTSLPLPYASSLSFLGAADNDKRSGRKEKARLPVLHGVFYYFIVFFFLKLRINISSPSQV
jgi:hypothetical protein